MERLAGERERDVTVMVVRVYEVRQCPSKEKSASFWRRMLEGGVKSAFEPICCETESEEHQS